MFKEKDPLTDDPLADSDQSFEPTYDTEFPYRDADSFSITPRDPAKSGKHLWDAYSATREAPTPTDFVRRVNDVAVSITLGGGGLWLFHDDGVWQTARNGRGSSRPITDASFIESHFEANGWYPVDTSVECPNCVEGSGPTLKAPLVYRLGVEGVYLDDPEWLMEMRELGHSNEAIADHLDTGEWIVWQAYNHHDLPNDDHPQSLDDDRLDNAEWLREQYWGNGQSLYEIAEKLDCSLTTVQSRLDECGIDRRTPEEALRVKTHQREYEHLDDAEWLETMYWGEEYSVHDIAEEIGCSYTAVRDAMVDHGIERRGRGRPETDE